MDRKEFLENFQLLLEHIVELRDIVRGIEQSHSASNAWTLETVKLQNRPMFYKANEKVTLYESVVNARVLRELTLEHPSSALVVCEQSIREKIISLFITELDLLADRCVAENEPEHREKFAIIISRITPKYHTDIENGDYMMYLAGWFKEAVEDTKKQLTNHPGTLSEKYLMLSALVRTTVILMEHNQRNKLSVGEEFAFHLNDWFVKFAESSEAERNKHL